MVTITDISNAIIIIDLIFAPKKMIIIGPSAILGRLFNTVRYGSTTLYIKLFHHNIIAVTIPIIVPIPKLIIVSYIVVQILLNKLLFLYKEKNK